KDFHGRDRAGRVAGGVGLGLSIVQRIAGVLDCEVTLKSNPDQGSRFSVAVPRAAAIGSALRPPATLRLEPGRLDGMVVLCIDNERAILDGMGTLLSGWGSRVLSGGDLAARLT